MSTNTKGVSVMVGAILEITQHALCVDAAQVQTLHFNVYFLLLNIHLTIYLCGCIDTPTVTRVSPTREGRGVHSSINSAQSVPHMEGEGKGREGRGSIDPPTREGRGCIECPPPDKKALIV